MSLVRVVAVPIVASLLIGGVPPVLRAQSPRPNAQVASRPTPPSLTAAGDTGSAADAPEREAPWVLRVVRSVEFTGFAAVQGTARSVPGDAYTISAAELDATAEFWPSLQGAIALARDGTQMVVAAGFLDLHLGGARVAPRGKIFAERGMHLQAGRFDIPFGGDWQRFAPPDRGLSSAPAITDIVSDGGLNDDGVRAFSVGARWNASAWLVRGALNGRAVGARVALTPFSNPFVFRAPASERPLELGLSVHADGREGKIVDQRAALDVDLRRGDLNLAAEWQERRVVQEMAGLTVGRARGWHVSGEVPAPTVGWASPLLLARWESMRGDALGTPELGDALRLTRAVAGTRVALGEWVLLKCEVGWRMGTTSADVMPARSWLLDAVIRW